MQPDLEVKIPTLEEVRKRTTGYIPNIEPCDLVAMYDQGFVDNKVIEKILENTSFMSIVELEANLMNIQYRFRQFFPEQNSSECFEKLCAVIHRHLIEIRGGTDAV